MNDRQSVDAYKEFFLSTPDAVDQAIFHGPGAKLGGVEPDISLKQVRVRIGRRPTIRNLRKLCDALGVAYSPDLKLFEKYGVWVVSCNVNLIKDGGFNLVTKLGCQIKYPENYAVSIVSQLPDSEFISKAGGELKAAASFSVTGDAKLPMIGMSAGDAAMNVGGGVTAEVDGNTHVNLSFRVLTEKVVATGTGDFLGEWSISRSEEPLVGEQQFLTTVLVPKDRNSLKVGVRAYVVVTTPYLVPARLQSEWVEMNLSLDADGEVGVES